MNSKPQAYMLITEEDGYCQSCDGNNCTAKDGCVARDNPPPQREWQGLTDDEMRKTVEGYFEFDGGDMWGSYRAVEAALKAKNG